MAFSIGGSVNPRQKRREKPQLILVILPEKEVGPYQEVKYASDVVLGVPSQCIVAKNAGIGMYLSLMVGAYAKVREVVTV